VSTGVLHAREVKVEEERLSPVLYGGRVFRVVRPDERYVPASWAGTSDGNKNDTTTMRANVIVNLRHFLLDLRKTTDWRHVM
jgi:hypothetical protein